MNEVPALPGLLHDLNNIFQTLVDAADLLSEDPRWKPVPQPSCAAWSGDGTWP